MWYKDTAYGYKFFIFETIDFVPTRYSFFVDLANMGLGMRYMAPPWPLNDYEKSEMYFKEAQKYIGNYSELYLNWGYLYLKMNNRTKALETFRKVLTLEPNELFLKAHEKDLLTAREPKPYK